MRYQFDTLSARPMRDQPIRRFSSFFAAALTTIGLLISTPTIAADPVSKKPADLAKGKTTAATVCAACHMPDGNSVIAQNPILAGQHAAYLEKQLYNFKLKAGAKEPERNNAIMLGFASMRSMQHKKQTMRPQNGKISSCLARRSIAVDFLRKACLPAPAATALMRPESQHSSHVSPDSIQSTPRRL
jgi:cytochrome c553